MKCPECEYHDTSVTDSRPAEIYGSDTVRRRRRCRKCDSRFSTYEVSMRQVSRIKLNALESESLAKFRDSVGSIIKELIEEALKEDFESRVMRFDTANRARKTRFIPKIEDSKIIA